MSNLFQFMFSNHLTKEWLIQQFFFIVNRQNCRYSFFIFFASFVFCCWNMKFFQLCKYYTAAFYYLYCLYCCWDLSFVFATSLDMFYDMVVLTMDEYNIPTQEKLPVRQTYRLFLLLTKLWPVLIHFHL